MFRMHALLVAVLLLAAGLAAQAAVVVGVNVQFPKAVVPGQAYSATVVLTNDNTPPQGDNPLNGNTISVVRLTPSCGEVAATATCPAASVDTGIFTLTSPAFATGECFGDGAGFFLFSAPDANGQVLLTPEFAPYFEINQGQPCTIHLQFQVNARATKDADNVLSGIQTAVLVDLTATDTQGFKGGGFGSDTISFPAITTTPGPGGTLPVGGGPDLNLTDTATIFGLVSTGSFEPPSGTVRFSLYAPDHPTCFGEALHQELVNLANCTIDDVSLQVTCSTSDTYTANSAGTWHWLVAYSGDGGHNPPLASNCADGPVVVNKATPMLTTIADPATGTQLQTPLVDSAMVTGYEPSGTLVFTLFPPSDPTCAGTGIFTELVSFNGLELPHTDFVPASLITQFGTYHWKVSWEGDANNHPVTSACAAEPVVISPATTLSVTKTPDGATIAPGDTATFSITVRNAGAATATNVVVSDPLPAGATLAWTTGSANCAITGSGAAQALFCTVASLAAGASFSATVSAVTSLGNCAALSNTATAHAAEAAAASDSASITCQQPVLAVSKTPDGATISAGDTATFAITVTNHGPGTARNVVVSDPLPAGATLGWHTGSAGCTIAGSGAAQALSCTIGSLAAGASFSATVSAVTAVGKCPTMNNTATAKGSNTAAASDGSRITCLQPVLSVAKTPEGGVVTAGDVATFTITVTNDGPGTARNVVITDPLPAGALLTWQTSTSGCTITGSGAAQTLSCSVASLADNASFTATVSAVTGVGTCATMTNTATAKGSNTAAASDGGSIACQQPVLAVAKTPDAGVVTAGEAATFTITVTNAGPGTARDVTLSDPLPAGALLAWQTGTSGCAITGSGAAQALSCTVASLAANASFTATVSALTGVGTCPAISNTATAKGSNTAAASGTGSLACQQPVLSVTKKPDGGAITAGEVATFTITVTNAGPGTARNVTVSDPLPAGELLAWQTSTSGCAITGSGAAQALSCTITSLAANASFAATVSAVTGVGTCPALNNTATAKGSNTAAASDAGSITCRTPPILSKSSDPATIGVGGTTTLTYTLTNVAGNPAEKVSFTDLLRSTLRVAAAANVGGTCPGAAAATTATPGGTTVTVTDLQVPPGPSSCTVTVVVTSAPGQTGTCPATGPSGIVSSSNILVDEAADACITVKTFASQLSITTLATLPLGDGTGGIATDPLQRRAYVTNATPPSVSVIDLDSLAVIATIPVPGHPENLVSNAANQRLYVVSDAAPGAVIVVDTMTNAVAATIAVGNHPQGIAADFQRGEVYVSNRGGNSLSVIDVATNAVVATIPAIGTQPGEPGVDANLGKIFVASAIDGTVTIIDRNTRAVRKVVSVGRNPGNASVSEAARKVYVNNVDDRTVSVIDSTTDAVVTTIAPIGAGSTFATISGVYRRAYLPNATDGTLSIIDIDADAVVKTLAVGASPQQAAVDPDKGDVYVVNRQSNTVSVIDAATMEVGATFGVGTDPWRVAVAPDRLLVLNENGAAADTLTIAFDGGTQIDTAIATEFYSSAIDHYDHTANSLEVRLVEDGIAGSAWMPTGEYFRVWTAPGVSRAAMCAFSTANFGDKNSSYFTPYAQECGELQNSAAWYYEGTAYYVAVPDAGGACPASTAELYLLYNNQQGGAPNFRYTGSRAVRDMMLVKGWTARGSGDQRVFACTPPLRGNP